MLTALGIRGFTCLRDLSLSLKVDVSHAIIPTVPMTTDKECPRLHGNYKPSHQDRLIDPN